MFDEILRKDEYGKNFYFEKDGKIKVVPYKTGKYSQDGIDFVIDENVFGSVLEISINITANTKINFERFGFRLGIDTYMEKYPEWNDKYFPTAMRCEKNGFWSCFITPNGEMFSVCSPSKIVSWKNEYNKSFADVGHRIYTSCVEFYNTYRQPQRHVENNVFEVGKTLCFKLYYSKITDENELYDFVEKYSGIHIPQVNKFTLESGENLFIDGKKYDDELNDGLNIIKNENSAQLSVFVRKDWFYYLKCAAEKASACQQKPGSHCESYYGYFTMLQYAKIIKNEDYTKQLCEQFDYFFKTLTKGNHRKKLKTKAYPNRLQNVSTLISILADFYELTSDIKYLCYAGDMAKWLMKLQIEDGSYRSHGVHYTCVIYPAKSMLELAIVEKTAGLEEKSQVHFYSAYRAIKNLCELMDNIETEGQMTFEDGMISCECLQIGYLATLLPSGDEKTLLTNCAEILMKKHRCLEQNILPDCRMRGCTLRFWEARYDLNFFANMLNCPHGWTSWKNYASYYLYLLTGKFEYLEDLMNTMGACMQCVDENGDLNWGFVSDACVVGQRLKKNCTKSNVGFEKVVAGEEYLPMISDWFKHSNKKLQFQYIRNLSVKYFWKKDFGGSCDNDVNEHFKCLCETVFGKSFIHEKNNGQTEMYNCFRVSENEFKTNDKYVNQVVYFSNSDKMILFNEKKMSLKKGLNTVELQYEN